MAKRKRKKVTETEHPRRLMVAEINEDALFADGFDDCIIGTADRHGMHAVAAYDYWGVIGKLMMDGMTRDEAIEFFDFNIVGAWMGENTPVFVNIFR